MTINQHDFASLEAARQELAEKYDPRTFTQRVIDRMFPHPLKPYGSEVWVVGRNLKMRQDGVLK